MPGDFNQLVPLDAATPSDGGLTFFGENRRELTRRMLALGEPGWRGRQLAEALYRQRVTEISSISTFPQSLRERLTKDGWKVGRPRIDQVFRSVDGTERYLIECPRSHGRGPARGDPGSGPKAETVETVWMPEGDDSELGDEEEAPSPQSSVILSESAAGGRVEGPAVRESERPRDGVDQVRGPRGQVFGREAPWRRATICVSSQIGCAVNCQFCLTAKLGLQRNLTAGEIAGQVLTVFDRHRVEIGRDRVNLVFMGMGEPFLNYDQFMAAVRLLVEEVGLSPQRMTVSTSGIVPGIERFAQEPPELRPRLAISLNAPNDQVRAEIMPINCKWPIEAVVDAVRQVRLRPRERITFEYVLLAGVTDRPEHAREVARLIRRTGLPAKVNLIAWNPGPGIPYAMPAAESVGAFKEALISAGIPAYVRKPRGRDIYAACGQLKRTVEG